VITVALQKDICLQGKTYLRKLTAIIKTKSRFLEAHKADLLKELKYNLRDICIKTKSINILALLACIKRIIHPKFTLNII
jgi:hypothetical protein